MDFSRQTDNKNCSSVETISTVVWPLPDFQQMTSPLPIDKELNTEKNQAFDLRIVVYK